MSKAHASHDFGPQGYCFSCATYCMALEAVMVCRPSTAEPVPDEQPVIIDWLELNKGFAT